jgi:NADH-quinone oxidoreductase subunit N
MTISISDVLATAPLTIVSLTALVLLVVESMKKKTDLIDPVLAVTGLAIAALWAGSSIGEVGKAYAGMVTTGGYANFFAVMFCAGGILCVMLSKSYVVKEGIEHGEFYALMLFAVVGMMLMAAAADLVILFIGLEIMSISFYVLAGFARTRLTSNEAALKYFLLGAFSTGFLLYGIALIYGMSGTTNIEAIVAKGGDLIGSPIFLIGLGLLMIGLTFKIAAVPFHMWAPDVYEGAPSTVSAFMSTGGKAAAFAAFLVVFAPKLVTHSLQVREILAGVAALSMILGGLFAIAQSNLKRMLAYSSVAHAGYILTGIVAANSYGSNGVLFYLAAYTVMNIGAFGVISLLESSEGGFLTFDDYAGLSTRNPVVAALMALFMFSLAGIPPFAGFFGKYYVFAGAIQGGFTWLAIVGVLMSAVSAYYYLRLVVMMYFKDSAGTAEQPVARLAFGALVISALLVIGMGLFPSLIVDLTSRFFS